MNTSATRWTRSSFCGGGGNNCLEVAGTSEGVAVRESERPAELLATAPAVFGALLAGVRSGRLERLNR